jgi:hypothetical protein
MAYKYSNFLNTADQEICSIQSTGLRPYEYVNVLWNLHVVKTYDHKFHTYKVSLLYGYDHGHAAFPPEQTFFHIRYIHTVSHQCECGNGILVALFAQTVYYKLHIYRVSLYCECVYEF